MKFKSIGAGCNISPKASFHNPEMITIGDNVRIDDFCVLSGGVGITIGAHIHIACYVSMFSGAGIVIGDFCQFGAYTVLLSESDDFSGDSMVGPQVPMEYKPGYKTGNPIIIKKHVVFGSRCTIFPGLTLDEGAIFGAHSLVNRNCEPWMMYAGTPIREIKARRKAVLELEQDFYKDQYPKYDLLADWRTR